MGRKKFIFISIIILFTIQTSACSAEGQESQGIWHNEYESEIEISSTEEERKDVSENKNITFRVLDGKEISVSRDRLRDTERINNRWSLEETDAMIAGAGIIGDSFELESLLRFAGKYIPNRDFIYWARSCERRIILELEKLATSQSEITSIPTYTNYLPI